MREILLTLGQVALVDDEDYEWLSAYSWHANQRRYSFYASRGHKHTLMQHEVMGGKPPPGFEFDHVDGNTLNNQKRNLRQVTKSQNQMNRHRTWGSSSFKGVNWHSSSTKWRAYIKIDGKQESLGYFTNEEEAARAYDKAAVEHFGEYARPNFGDNGNVTVE